MNISEAIKRVLTKVTSSRVAFGGVSLGLGVDQVQEGQWTKAALILGIYAIYVGSETFLRLRGKG